MIRVECPKCGTRLRGPDEAAGKQIKCPKCGGQIPVPEKVYEPEPLLGGDDYGPPAGAYDLDDMAPKSSSSSDAYDTAEPSGSDERRKPCPVCGEMIVASAAKCRFCGEIFDPKLKKAKAKSKGKSKGKKSYSEDEDLSSTDVVLCLLCPGLACIASVIYMIQGKLGKGLKVLGLAFVGGIIQSIVREVIWPTINQQGGQ